MISHNFYHKMLIRLEQSFVESAEKLNDRFSEQDMEEGYHKQFKQIMKR